MTMTKNGLIGAALTGLIALTSIIPAQAQTVTFGYNERDRVVSSYCDRNPRDRDCRRYRNGGWDNNDYNNFYGRHRGGLDSIASGFFGFTFGAILGSALANSNNNNNGGGYQGGGYSSNHVDACYARYRSYDERSDTFLGYDGRRHRCNL